MIELRTHPLQRDSDEKKMLHFAFFFSKFEIFEKCSKNSFLKGSINFVLHILTLNFKQFARFLPVMHFSFYQLKCEEVSQRLSPRFNKLCLIFFLKLFSSYFCIKKMATLASVFPITPVFNEKTKTIFRTKPLPASVELGTWG